MLGSAAAALGLSGEVSAEQFERLFAGQHPGTGTLLGRLHRSGGNLAWDLVFRPTKSVSLLYGIGTREQSSAAKAAHHAGVAAAVAKLETYAAVRRGRNGVDRHAASGLPVIGFDHRASRPGDPLLHTHAIVMNRAQGPDERWTAPDARPLLAALMEADAVYRATYQHELTRTLGVEWAAPDEHGNCELAGMPEEVIRHFSKAAARIDEECVEREQQGEKAIPAVRNMLAHKLREDKCHEALVTQRQRWAAEEADHGWDLPGLFDRLCGRVRTCDTLDADTAEAVFGRLAGPDGLTAQTSTFTRGRVLRAVSNQPEATTLPVEVLESLADRFVAERAVPALVDSRTGAQRYSTPELLALEQQIVDTAKARMDEDRHVVSRRVVAAVIDRYADMGCPLGDDQAAALRAVCGGRGGVLPIVDLQPGCVFHSDLGTQHTSCRLRARLAEYGLRGSVGRTGVWDNATAESFSAALKNEWLNRMVSATKGQARREVVKHIEGFYNRKRLHSGLGYRVPSEVPQRVGEPAAHSMK